MYPRIFGHEAIGLVLHFLSSDYWHWHCVESHSDYHDKLSKLLKKCEFNSLIIILTLINFNVL